MTENRIEKLHRLASELSSLQDRYRNARTFQEIKGIRTEIEWEAVDIQELTMDFAERRSYQVPEMTLTVARELWLLAKELEVDCLKLHHHSIGERMAEICALLEVVFSSELQIKVPDQEVILPYLIEALGESGSQAVGLRVVRKIRERVLKLSREAQSRKEEASRIANRVRDDILFRYVHDEKLHKLHAKQKCQLDPLWSALDVQIQELDRLYNSRHPIILFCDLYLEIDSAPRPAAHIVPTPEELRITLRKYFEDRIEVLKHLEKYVIQQERVQRHNCRIPGSVGLTKRPPPPPPTANPLRRRGFVFYRWTTD